MKSSSIWRYVVNVKSMVKIFVAFLENMNFNSQVWAVIDVCSI